MRDRFYFKHDMGAFRDSKIVQLRMKHGISGYGLYWYVIEQLYENGGSIVEDYASIAYDTRCDAVMVESVIKDFDLFDVKDGRITCGRVIEAMQERIELSELGKSHIRRRVREDGTPWVNNRDLVGRQKGASRTLIPGEERRGEERRGKEITDKQPSSSGDDGFADFWQAYPKKVGKATAQKAWRRKTLYAILYSKVLPALQAQKNSPQWLKDNGQFIPHPATWLNQERWEDEVKAYEGTNDSAVKATDAFLASRRIAS